MEPNRGFAWHLFQCGLGQYLGECSDYTAWVNQGLDTRVRATVISASSQANALGQILGGPVLGAIGRGISLSAALVSSGLVLAPVMGLYMFAMHKGKISA